MLNNTIREITQRDIGVSVIFLLALIRKYRNFAREIQIQLADAPNEWGKYQSLFNYEINGIFRLIMEFEKENLTKGNAEKVNKLKRLFIKHIRREFLCGEYIDWSLKKPFGYAGDYKIINDIYANSPKTVGFERLFDNYFQMSAISVAVRNRKNDFKKYLLKLISDKNTTMRFANLGCGPCRELYEIFLLNHISSPKIVIDCYDNDEKALKYSEQLLSKKRNINLIKQNAVRLALTKNIRTILHHQYDFIYSLGLFDYFGDKLSYRLICNLKASLKKGGVLAIANVRDKFSNPSVHFMEWVGEWNLVYRSDDEFQRIFFDAGFRKEDLTVGYEQQGILQYVFAVNNI